MIEIQDMIKDEMPREKLSQYGPKNLTNSDLVALIIGKGTKSNNVLQVSKNLIKKYSLKSLSDITFTQLQKVNGIGYTKACSILASIELGKRISNYVPKATKPINTSKDAFNLLYADLLNQEQEIFMCLFLNTRNKLISKKALFIGTIDKQLISPREIAKKALLEGATKVIISHNHPSGNLEPSDCDMESTKKIDKALSLFSIELLDHIIISNKKYLSFKDRNHFI
ncbi:MAG: RadC family protein [Nanobdellota archaeon]